jgi:hypothetical protein
MRALELRALELRALELRALELRALELGSLEGTHSLEGTRTLSTAPAGASCRRNPCFPRVFAGFVDSAQLESLELRSLEGMHALEPAPRGNACPLRRPVPASASANLAEAAGGRRCYWSLMLPITGRRPVASGQRLVRTLPRRPVAHRSVRTLPRRPAANWPMLASTRRPVASSKAAGAGLGQRPVPTSARRPAPASASGSLASAGLGQCQPCRGGRRLSREHQSAAGAKLGKVSTGHWPVPATARWPVPTLPRRPVPATARSVVSDSVPPRAVICVFPAKNALSPRVIHS